MECSKWTTVESPDNKTWTRCTMFFLNDTIFSRLSKLYPASFKYKSDTVDHFCSPFVSCCFFPQNITYGYFFYYCNVRFGLLQAWYYIKLHSDYFMIILKYMVQLGNSLVLHHDLERNQALRIHYWIHHIGTIGTT